MIHSLLNEELREMISNTGVTARISEHSEAYRLCGIQDGFKLEERDVVDSRDGDRDLFPARQNGNQVGAYNETYNDEENERHKGAEQSGGCCEGHSGELRRFGTWANAKK